MVNFPTGKQTGIAVDWHIRESKAAPGATKIAQKKPPENLYTCMLRNKHYCNMLKKKKKKQIKYIGLYHPE